MALDFTGIDEAGATTGGHVPIECKTHTQLFWRLPQARFDLLERLRDYWEDALFTVDELPRLLAELDAYRREQEDAALADILRRMQAVVLQALDEGTAVEAIAD